MKYPPVKELPPMTEVRTKLLGIAASNPFVNYNSPARQQMYTNSHMSQKIVTSGMSENFLSTHMDTVLADATMGIRMPKNGMILSQIQRYPDNGAGDSIAINPETVVLFEDVDSKSKELGVLRITNHKSHHAYFGYDLVPTKDANKILPGNVIPRDTVLFDSPGRSPVGRYMSGVMLQTAFWGHRATAEDGLVVSRAALPALRYKRFERRTVEWGKDTFALNIYGDEKNYKVMPDIGDYVLPDGLLCATRSRVTQDGIERFAPVDLSVNGSRRIDYTNDNLTYAKGKGGKVVDILVTLNYDYDGKGLADMNKQLFKYIEARRRFNKELITKYLQIVRQRPGVSVSRELHAMLVQAMIENGHDKQRFCKVFKKVEIDNIRVDFIIEYEVEPNIGHKLTETSGGKGIIVAIEKAENMPVDKYGKRCDILSAFEARTNRMNSGGLHELFYNDANWHVRRRVLEMMGIPFFEGITLRDRTTVSYKREEKARQLANSRAEVLKEMYRTDPTKISQVWDFVIGYYRRLSPYQAHQFDRYPTTPWPMVFSNLANIIEDMTYVEVPPDYAVDYFTMSTEIAQYVGFERDRVEFVGLKGIKEMTDGKVRIAPMKWMLLEKTGDTWSAVSFAKVQQYGFLAQINNSDRYSDPGRPQPIKGAGETEFRIIVSTCGQVAAAELGDRNNNPRTRRQLHRTIITHETPGNIENAIDRNAIPYGGHRGVQILHHFLNCGGIALAYAEEEGT